MDAQSRDQGVYSISLSGFADIENSGQFGWIYVLKHEFLQQTGCREENWRESALETIRKEVETYQQYLSGEVYWVELFRQDQNGEWQTFDSSRYFYGSDIMKNGVLDFSDELREAIQSGKYTIGKAEDEIVTVVTWQFD